MSWAQLGVDVGTGCVDILENQERSADIVRLMKPAEMKVVEMDSPDKWCWCGKQHHTKKGSGLEGRNSLDCFRSQMGVDLTEEGRRCLGVVQCNSGHQNLCCTDFGCTRVAVEAMTLEDGMKSAPIGSHLEGQDRSLNGKDHRLVDQVLALLDCGCLCAVSPIPFSDCVRPVGHHQDALLSEYYVQGSTSPSEE